MDNTISYDADDNITGYDEHVRDSEYTGDARRCSRHPHITTSSDNGMIDGLCNECEYEMDIAEQAFI